MFANFVSHVLTTATIVIAQHRLRVSSQHFHRGIHHITHTHALDLGFTDADHLERTEMPLNRVKCRAAIGEKRSCQLSTKLCIPLEHRTPRQVLSVMNRRVRTVIHPQLNNIRIERVQHPNRCIRMLEGLRRQNLICVLPQRRKTQCRMAGSNRLIHLEKLLWNAPDIMADRRIGSPSWTIGRRVGGPIAGLFIRGPDKRVIRERRHHHRSRIALQDINHGWSATLHKTKSRQARVGNHIFMVTDPQLIEGTLEIVRRDVLIPSATHEVKHDAHRKGFSRDVGCIAAW